MQASAQSAPKAVPLPPIREDLKLMPGPRHRDGSPSWRILDPIRNQFFEIGWLEFELLARWSQYPDADVLAAAVEQETTLVPTTEEIQELIQFMAVNQMLAPETQAIRQDLRKRMKMKSRPWYETLLHHYLFFRVPLVRPDAFLQRTLPWVEIFFTRGFAFTVFGVLLIDLFLLTREWHSYRESFVHFFSLTGLFYYALAATFAKVIHELGHAYAAKRNGVRVPAMGVSFLVMWPFLYTDTAETWKLADRKKQLQISSAGMLAELVLAVFCTLLWSIAPDGGFKSVLFILATTTWVMTLAINASPFMRFDGYFVLSDALDFPNLHERGSACTKWFLRTTFFRLAEPMPEPTLGRRNRVLLIIFTLITWVYRLIVFLGIALMVYHLFLKLLGIFLMLVEVIWFIFRPLAKEAQYLWERRAHVRVAWQPSLALLASLLLLVWVVPISSQVTAPAVMRAENEQAVYAPFASKLSMLSVKPGQRVQAGDQLAILDVPELETRWRQAEVAIDSVRAELQRAPASVRQLEQQSVLQEKLAQSLAEQQAVHEEAQRLVLRANYSGIVRDVPSDLVEGRWVNQHQLLMRVVSDSSQMIEMYVRENQVGAIEPGQVVKFFPAVPKIPVVRGTVVAIDKTPSRQITRPLLASTHGGQLSAVKDQKDGLIAYDATFRVLVRPLNGERADVQGFVMRGTARVETDLRFIAENFFSRLVSILIRESGF
jgi:putative peptide zinc metalloprotease protein